MPTHRGVERHRDMSPNIRPLERIGNDPTSSFSNRNIVPDLPYTDVLVVFTNSDLLRGDFQAGEHSNSAAMRFYKHPFALMDTAVDAIYRFMPVRAKARAWMSKENNGDWLLINTAPSS